MRLRRRAGMCVVLGLAVLSGAASAQQEPLKLSGSVKSILLRSETLDGESFTLDLNRLRIEAKGNITSALRLDLQFDHEVLLGSYLHTAQFRSEKDAAPPQYWRAESNIFESGDAYVRERLYRASLTGSFESVDLRLGRQRIAWGTGRFWSPLDILNPVSPIAIERDERLGVDAALLEAKFGPLSRLSVAYAPQRRPRGTSAAVQWHSNVGGYDYSLVGGRVDRQGIVGFDVAGQIAQAGLRAEAARLHPTGANAFQRFLVGLDYAFANTLIVSGELYYNGGGRSNREAYDFASLAAGRTLSVATRYVGLFASYDLTPLLKWSNYLIVNADDGSRVFDSRLAWALRADLELTLGVQSLAGSAGSEYGRLPSAVLAQARWFF